MNYFEGHLFVHCFVYYCCSFAKNMNTINIICSNYKTVFIISHCCLFVFLVYKQRCRKRYWCYCRMMRGMSIFTYRWHLNIKIINKIRTDIRIMKRTIYLMYEFYKLQKDKFHNKVLTSLWNMSASSKCFWLTYYLNSLLTKQIQLCRTCRFLDDFFVLICIFDPY